MDAAPPPQSPWPDDPVPLPCGGETLARCAVCGAGFIPRDRAQRTCARAECRAAFTARTDAARSKRTHARHRSYRLACMALRAGGRDPATVPALETLRGRGDVPEWRELVGLDPAPTSDACARCGGPRTGRGRFCGAVCRRTAKGLPVTGERRAEPAGAPWGAAVGTQPEHVAWGVSLDGIPGAAPARLVHGLVSRLVGVDHAQVARWALAMPSGAHGSGWGVVLFHRDDADRLAGRAERVRVGTREHDLRTGPVVRLRAPPAPARGKHRVTVDAVTPVSHLVDGRTRAITTPTVQTILGACADVAQRLGLTTGRLHVAEVACDTVPERVTLGGHMGSVPGWVGRVTVVCNAPAAWLLACARHAGLGGRVAFGMGRVRVST